MDKSLSLGYLLAGLFVFLSATRDLWGSLLLQGLPVHATLLASFTTTVVVAQLWNRIKSTSNLTHRDTTGLWRDTLWLNFTTLISWVATFEGLARILPSTLAALTVGGIPLATLVLDRVLRKKEIRRQSILNACLIIVGISIMSYRELMSHSSSGNRTSIIAGMICSLIAAVFAAGNNVFAKKINDRGYSGTEVFASRFWLLLVACVVWCVIDSNTLPANPKQWAQITSLGFIGIALPVICLQLSIERIGPRLVGFLIAAIPVLVALGECLIPGVVKPTSAFVPTLPVGLALVVGGILREVLQARKKNA